MRCSECQVPIRPCVAVDIDGTTADYHRHFFMFAARWLGQDPYGTIVAHWCEDYHGDVSIAEFMGIDKRTYRQIKLSYRQGGQKRSMPMMPGAQELFCLLRKLDIEIWITTTRPYLQVGNVDEDTREWLRRNELSYDYIVYDDLKYQRLLEQVDPTRVLAALDDQFEDWVSAGWCGFNPIMIRTRYNYLDAGTKSVANHLIADGLEEAMITITERVQAWRKTNGAASD